MDTPLSIVGSQDEANSRKSRLEEIYPGKVFTVDPHDRKFQITLKSSEQTTLADQDSMRRTASGYMNDPTPKEKEERMVPFKQAPKTVIPNKKPQVESAKPIETPGKTNL